MGFFVNKRKYPRIPCSAPIEYVIGTRTYRNLSRNISAGGLFIETWNSFSIGDRLVVNIPLWDNQKNIQVDGEIVRAESQGIGVRFT